MSTDESILEEMLDRATNPERETSDELGVGIFCMVVRNNGQIVHKAQEMLINKIRSNNVTEATRAITLLEECMTKCGSEFQDEVAKFRFLNDLIRLVSKKYQGAETSDSIKQRIMECLLLWTTEFPQKAKIREAYDMLRKEGEVVVGSSSAAIAKRESILGIDGEMLSKLVHSKDPENYRRANLLIQHRVNQEERRNELLTRHHAELQEVQNTVGLLDQMLDTYVADGGIAVEGSDTMNLIRELFMACKKHKPILQRLPELMENVDDSLIADTLEANDLLLAVMKRYKNIIVHPNNASGGAQLTTSSSTSTNSTDLLAALLGDTLPAPSLLSTNVNNTSNFTPSASAVAGTANNAANALENEFNSTATTFKLQPKETTNNLDDLHAIFANVHEAEESTKSVNELFGDLNLLEPVSVLSNVETSAAVPISTSQPTKGTFRQLREIDQLSEQLFQQSLQENVRVRSFKKESFDKPTLNDLVKEKTNPTPPQTAITTPQRSAKAALERLTKSMQQFTKSNLEDDACMLSGMENETTTTIKTQDKVKETQKKDEEMLSVNKKENETTKALTKTTTTSLPIKHLSEITIDLDNVTPSEEERILMQDDDLKVTLNFTEERPSKHVSVIVISVANKSKMSIKDFQFEASVKKPSKVRLLPANSDVLPPCKPFRPATPINQVMLLLNPTGNAVDVTCIVSYKLGDDPDAIKESITAKNIPFVE